MKLRWGILGVAKINTFMAWGTGPMDTIFLPYGTPNGRDVMLAARSTGDPHSLVEPIRAMIHDLDPDQAMPTPALGRTRLASFLERQC